MMSVILVDEIQTFGQLPAPSDTIDVTMFHSNTMHLVFTHAAAVPNFRSAAIFLIFVSHSAQNRRALPVLSIWTGMTY